MAITENFKHARWELWNKQRRLKRLIGKSRQQHGMWVVARKSDPKSTATRKAFDNWRATVREVHAVSQRINALSIYLRRGAVAATLDLTKAIAVWEGGKSADGLFYPYQDAVGVWTIGYGHTAANGSPYPGRTTAPLTEDEATILLLHDINSSYAVSTHTAYKSFGWKVNQKQFDATVDFAYNLGPGYFTRGNSMGDAMSTRNSALVANAMLLYDHAGNQRLPGLTRRRHWENQLCMGGTYSVTN